MILLLDLGNTNLYVGVCENNRIVTEFRKHTDLNRSSDEYLEVLQSFFLTHKLNPNDFNGAIISSVIPSLTLTIKTAVEKLIKHECLVVNKKIKTGLNIKIDNPSELGADLVTDCVGALAKYQAPLIIADLGTANKILVVDKNGSFVGCTISVGVKIGAKSLTNNTAQLMDVSLVPPNKVIGKNSPDSLNSGATYGTCCMIEGMASKIEAELGYPCTRILTGGNSYLIKDIIDKSFIHEPKLILEGLKCIYYKNK